MNKISEFGEEVLSKTIGEKTKAVISKHDYSDGKSNLGLFSVNYVSKASDGSAIKTSFYVKVLVVSTKIDLKELKSKLPNDMEVFLEEGEGK